MEVYEKESVSLYLSDLHLIENVVSKVQDIKIYQHLTLGKVLVINDEIHNVENWAPLYHEAITHIPMMFIEHPLSVLILGGGDLYAAEIALQYPTVQKVIVCDYDPEVIRLTKSYYPHAKAVLSDSRLSIVYQDAKIFLKECSEQFDLIIDDCFNLVEDFLPEDQIFEVLNRHLTSDIGVCSSLIYMHIFDSNTMAKTSKNLFSQYKTVLSMVAVPEYPGVLHLLTMWGQSKYLSQNIIKSKNKWHIDRLSKSETCGQIFDPRYCNYYLYLPPYIKSRLTDMKGC